MSKLRLVFFGTSTFAVPSLEELAKERDIEIVGIVTQPDRPAGRGKKLTPPPVKRKAQELGLAPLVYQPEKIRSEEFKNWFYALKPDVAVVVAYGKLIPKHIFEFPKYKTLNLHASLLPKYRGAAPIHRAIMAGEKLTGNTVMLINEGLDSGDILSQEEEPIYERDNIVSLSERLATKGAKLLVKTLKEWVEGKITPKAQEHSKATYAPPIAREEYRICWKAAAQSVADRIRALYPNAYTTFGGKRIKVLSAEVTDIKSELPPGTVYPYYKDGLYVVCGDQRVVKILELINPKGKKVKGEDFIRGYKVERFT